MRKKIVFVVTLAVVATWVYGLLLAADDLSQQLLDVRRLAEGKKYGEAIAAYEKLLQQAPGLLQGAVQFEIAGLHAAAGDSDHSLAMMEQAVQSGFDDCLAMQLREELNAVRSDPRFKEAYSRIRLSEADLKELYWLKAEIQNVSHETKIMITENVNRLDTGITLIPRSTIPARETASPGVLFNRELLKMMHQLQMEYVFASDKVRMRHVSSMAIISGGMSYDLVVRSSRLAQVAAEERKRAIEARRFILPPGVGTAPRSCSEYK